MSLVLQGSLDLSSNSSSIFIYGTFVVRIVLTIACYVTAAITMPTFERSFNFRYAIADIIASSCLLIQDMMAQYQVHKILVEAAKEGINRGEDATTITVNDLRE